MPAKAVVATLRHVWVTLEPLKLPMAVMGGLAVAVWEHVRATQDVDLLVGVGEADVGAVVERLAQAKVRSKRASPVLTVGPVQIVQLLYEPPDSFVDVQVDLLLAQSEYHRAALQRRTAARLPELDFEVQVLSCEDLILHKLLAARILDRVDAAALLRANREGIDLSYLTSWVGNLSLDAELAEVWQGAFPGEKPPASVRRRETQ